MEQVLPQQDSVQPLPDVVGRLISLPTSHSPSYSVMHVRLAPSVNSLPPGAWVAIAIGHPDDGVRVLARVKDAWEHNPHEDAQSSLIGDILPFKTEYAHEGESTVIYRLLEVEPMEQLLTDASGSVAVKEVTDLPRAGALVFLADNEAIVASLGLEGDPNEGLHVGKLRGGADTAAIISKAAIQRHVFIGGGIGSGKSYTRGVLAEELHMLGVPQINIDVNGEMIDTTRELGGLNLVPGKSGFTLPLSSLTANDVIDAIPGMRSGTNYETLIRYAHEQLLKDRTLRLGLEFGVSDLVQAIEQVAPTLQMEAAGTLRPAKQRASSLENIPYIGKPFNWKEHIRPGAMINIDCRGLLVSDLRLIVASIARDLQRLAKGKDNLFVAFSIDEFHLVAPNDDKSVTTQVLREIARIGRHYKIGLILTTQSPQDVDRSILKRLLTRFLHAIEPDQLDALRGIFADAPEQLIKSLPKLPQGTAIVTGAFETIRHAAVVDIRLRQTTHGGASPDIYADFAARGWTGKHPLNLSGEGRGAG